MNRAVPATTEDPVKRTTIRCAVAALIAASSLGAASCAESDEPAPWTQESIDPGPPIVIGERFAVVSEGLGDVWFFEPGASHVDVSSVPLDGTPVYTERAPGGELMVLTQNPDELLVFPAAGGEPEVREVSAAYDAIAISDDSRFVVLYFSPGSVGAPGRILFNPNEMTVIDRLEDTTRVFTLSGPRPSWVHFAPEFTLADPERPLRYAVVAGDSAVSFVELATDEDGDRQRLVPLSEPSSGRSLVPRTVTFNEDDPDDPNDMTAYVLASGSDELFAIDLLPADPATGRTLQPAINQITAIPSPLEMHQYFVDGREKLLVTSSSQAAVAVVDVPTGNVTRVDLDRRLPSALVWESEEAGAVRPRALMYRSGDAIVFFADLDAIERQGMAAMRARRLGDLVSDVSMVETSGDLRAVARYANQRGLSVLNLETRAETPIPSQLTLGEFTIAGDLFLTVVPGVEALAVVDLVTGSPAEIPLDASGQDVFAVPDRNTLVVSHGGGASWYSFFSLADLESGAHTVLRSPLYGGLLERDFTASSEEE